MAAFLITTTDGSIRSKDGDSPLQFVVEHADNAELARSLNIPVDVQNRRGITPLMLAASHNHHQLVKYLLADGADPTVKDLRGRIALDFAQVYPKREECIALLEAGAR